MSEENKCNGLDCAICAETKCPNEKPIINGIDVSESVLTATNNDVYYSQKAVDELQNVIKRLQEENEKLKKLKKYYKGFVANCKYCDEWYMDKCNYIKKDNKYKQALEEIRNEYTNSIFYECDKTEEECPCHNCIILGQLDRVQNIVKIIDEVLNGRD